MLALAVAFGLSQEPVASRTEQVLALVSAAAGEMNRGWYTEARYSEATPGHVEPTIPITCGNSDNGLVPEEPLRAFAWRACRIYGLDVTVDHPLRLPEHAVEARLDAVDERLRIAVNLAGHVPADNDMMSEAVVEPEAAALSDEEAARLRALGYRLHVDDLTRLRCYDGGTFATSVAYFAGVVSFLNEVTEGEDVDLGGVLFAREATWSPARPLPLVEGIVCASSKSDRFFDGTYEVRSRTRVELACAGLRDHRESQQSWFGLDEPQRIAASTRGAASTLHVDAHAWAADKGPGAVECRLRFRQRIEGVERTCEGVLGSLTLFLPPEFDLCEPFTLELDLGPGQYWFNEARLGASSRPR